MSIFTSLLSTIVKRPTEFISYRKIYSSFISLTNRLKHLVIFFLFRQKLLRIDDRVDICSVE